MRLIGHFGANKRMNTASQIWPCADTWATTLLLIILNRQNSITKSSKKKIAMLMNKLNQNPCSCDCCPSTKKYQK